MPSYDTFLDGGKAFRRRRRDASHAPQPMSRWQGSSDAWIGRIFHGERGGKKNRTSRAFETRVGRAMRHSVIRHSPSVPTTPLKGGLFLSIDSAGKTMLKLSLGDGVRLNRLRGLMTPTCIRAAGVRMTDRRCPDGRLALASLGGRNSSCDRSPQARRADSRQRSTAALPLRSGFV